VQTSHLFMKFNKSRFVKAGILNVAPGIYINLAVLSIFFLLSLIGILHHEIWLDEAQHFLIARDSRSLLELFRVCRIEGHPILWNILLFLITRFSSNPFWMQFVHIMISCVTVTFLLKSKLNLLEKILIIFGYYFFYEYNIISRNYGISALMMVLLVHYYIREPVRITRLAVILFFIAQTHLFSLLFSVAFVLAYFLHHKRSLLNQGRRILITAGLIILAGWLISVYFIIPPWDYGMKFLSYDPSAYFSTERIIKTVSVGLKGIFYIPDYHAPEHHFFNSLYFLTLNLRSWKIYFLSALSLIIPAIILKNNRFALILFSAYVLIFISIYFYLPLVNGIRYFGFLYIAFICCYIIARPQVVKYGMYGVILMLALQFANGIYAYSMDFRYPFSEGKNVSHYIKLVRLKDEKIYILNPTLRPVISAYTGEKYFGTENGQNLSYCLWDESLPDSVLRIKLQTAMHKDSTSLIISNSDIHDLLDTTKLHRLQSFNQGIFKGEDAEVRRYRN
jgi:hypothetical protein